MKQHITVEQLTALPDESVHWLYDHWYPAEGDWIANMSAVNGPYVFVNAMEQPEWRSSRWALLIPEKRSHLHRLPTIGQMCELLTSARFAFAIQHPNTSGAWRVVSDDFSTTVAANLCDALWEMVAAYVARRVADED